MLACYLLNRPGKRSIPAQPLIDHHGQAILIAGRTWFTCELLRRHVDDRPSRLLDRLGGCALGNDGNAKFGEQDLTVTPQQHILRPDIAMDQFLLMDRVQGLSHLPDVGDNGCKWHPSALWVALAQRAMRGILHDQKRDALFYAKIEDAHDVGMHEARNHARLRAESLFVLTVEVGMQHFDGSLRVEMQVFPQVDFGKATPADQMQQSIVAKLLSHTVAHPPSPHGSFVIRSQASPGCKGTSLSFKGFIDALQ